MNESDFQGFLLEHAGDIDATAQVFGLSERQKNTLVTLLRIAFARGAHSALMGELTRVKNGHA